MVSALLVERKPRFAHPYVKEGFMLLSKRGLRELDARLADRSIGMQAVRVLVAMTTACDYENRVRMGQKDLAAHLRMDQAAVSRATRDLVECGFVERPESSRGYYRLSPHLLWQGGSKTLKRALDERQAA